MCVFRTRNGWTSFFFIKVKTLDIESNDLNVKTREIRTIYWFFSLVPLAHIRDTVGKIQCKIGKRNMPSECKVPKPRDNNSILIVIVYLISDKRIQI